MLFLSCISSYSMLFRCFVSPFLSFFLSFITLFVFLQPLFPLLFLQFFFLTLTIYFSYLFSPLLSLPFLPLFLALIFDPLPTQNFLRNIGFIVLTNSMYWSNEKKIQLKKPFPFFITSTNLISISRSVWRTCVCAWRELHVYWSPSSMFASRATLTHRCCRRLHLCYGCRHHHQTSATTLLSPRHCCVTPKFSSLLPLHYDLQNAITLITFTRTLSHCSL